jgi:hypothetical protein
MKHLNSQELHRAMDEALAEVRRQAASGELDGSGRFYTDAELAAGAATGESKPPQKHAEDPAA